MTGLGWAFLGIAAALTVYGVILVVENVAVIDPIGCIDDNLADDFDPIDPTGDDRASDYSASMWAELDSAARPFDQERD